MGHNRQANKRAELPVLFDESHRTGAGGRNGPIVRDVGGQCAIRKPGGRSKRRKRKSMKAVQFALAVVLASGAVLSAQEQTPRYEVGLNFLVACELG
jgi:hypothetical protein